MQAKVKVKVCVCSLTSLSSIVPDTGHDTQSLYPDSVSNSPSPSAKRGGAASTIFNDFGMSLPGSNLWSPVPQTDTLPAELVRPGQGHEHSWIWTLYEFVRNE